MSDSLAQRLGGLPLFCNPPYKMSGPFITKCEAAREADHRTKALLLIPIKSDPDFTHFVSGNAWRALYYFPYGTEHLFTSVADANPYAPARHKLPHSIQDIVGYTLRPARRPGPTVAQQLALTNYGKRGFTFDELELLRRWKEQREAKRQQKRMRRQQQEGMPVMSWHEDEDESEDEDEDESDYAQSTMEDFDGARTRPKGGHDFVMSVAGAHTSTAR